MNDTTTAPGDAFTFPDAPSCTPPIIVGRIENLGDFDSPTRIIRVEEAPPPPARAVSTAWLLERVLWPGAEPLYYAAIAGRFKWSPDLYVGLRFARKEDAEAMRRTLPATLLEDGDIHVKEHPFL